jgi:DNA-binding NtrC family response regulator
MPKTILLAARPQEREILRSVIQKSTHMLIITGSLGEVIAHLSEMQIQIAVIDEDFDGLGTGWMLAESIRRHLASSVKIIMLVRGRPHKYYKSKEFEGKFDWVMSFPISDEQLLHELERNELITLS